MDQSIKDLNGKVNLILRFVVHYAMKTPGGTLPQFQVVLPCHWMYMIRFVFRLFFLGGTATRAKIWSRNLQERDHLECEVLHFLWKSEWSGPRTLKVLNY